MNPEDRLQWAIEYAGLRLDLRGTRPWKDAIAARLAPFFRTTQASDRPVLLDLELASEASPRARKRSGTDGRPIAVDTSLYEHLASTGTRWDDDEGHLVRIDATGSLFEAWPDRGSARLSNATPERLIRDAVRTIKGLFTQGVERQGGVQLHSSGVVVDGRGVLIVGDMWQGKTTLLLELMSSFRVDQLSCDTVVLRQDDGRFPAWGWPSPFSVNHGTLADHPELGVYFPEARRGTPYPELWRQRRKSVLDNQRVVEAFDVALIPHVADLGCVLIARFDPEAPTRIEPLTDPTRFLELLRPCYLGSRDPIYHAWHGCFSVSEDEIDRNLAAIARGLLATVPVHVLTWAPSATSLMKGIPMLASAHPHLSRILF